MMKTKCFNCNDKKYKEWITWDGRYRKENCEHCKELCDSFVPTKKNTMLKIICVILFIFNILLII